MSIQSWDIDCILHFFPCNLTDTGIQFQFGINMLPMLMRNFLELLTVLENSAQCFEGRYTCPFNPATLTASCISFLAISLTLESNFNLA